MGFPSPRTLRADLAQGRLPAARVLEIGLALTEALGHLHRHGLVHRDVKPSNVIFVEGRPKLADIGLVTDASDTCSIVGTEGYLPPEGPGTASADLFALGKVLYEATTGGTGLFSPGRKARSALRIRPLPARCFPWWPGSGGWSSTRTPSPPHPATGWPRRPRDLAWTG